MHIAIAGNIGSGKSTLTKMLAKHYGWEPRYEAVEHNPYLEDYYRDIHRWSFNLEVYFLKERFRDLLTIAEADHTIIQDRTIYRTTKRWEISLNEITRLTWNFSNK